MSSERFGVLLMTYGSPASLDDVGRYLTAVRGGRAPDAELVAEFERRYALIGGSPLIDITTAQAAALEARLGGRAIVRAAMRFSEPTIADQLAMLAGDVATAVAIVMSPQYSPLLMGGYGRALQTVREALGDAAPAVRSAGAWHRSEGFLDAMAERIREGLAAFPDDERDAVPVALTAHSLPSRIARDEPGYIAQLRETATEVARRAGLDHDRWLFCWQSAGHEPGEWMKPDFADVMPRLGAEGHRAVLVAPIQFLADHLEILYDLDIAAREQAAAAGLRFHRIESLNVMPRFIGALADVALATLETLSIRPREVASPS
jgi:ferrochelatase